MTSAGDLDGHVDARLDADVDPDLVERLCAVVATVPGEVRGVVRRHVDDVAPLADRSTRERLIRAAVARLAGLDALDALIADPTVDEVLVNRGGEVWIDRAGVLERSQPLEPDALPIVLERILAPVGRRLDRTNPIVDARLADGSRVCAVIEPVAVDGAALSIRRFRRRAMPLAAFCGPAVEALLREIVAARCNVVVTGATSSGKSSLIAALLSTITTGERIILIEDTAELAPDAEHLVRLEARAATVDGVRAIALDELVRTALRLRPDRLVVGEVRGAEVLALVQAMNTGHDGSLSTCHANGPTDALHRLETLVLQAAPAWPLAAIRSQLSRSIDVIVHVARRPDGARRVASVGEVVVGDAPPRVEPLAADDRLARPLRRGRAC